VDTANPPDAAGDRPGSDVARTVLFGVAGIAVAYAALWIALGGLPFQDIPNHVARAIVIGDLVLDGGRRFGEHFTFEWQAIPYILGDALLLPLVRLLPADVAGRAWVFLEWASLPLATAWLLHAWRAPRLTLAIGLAFALYLATDVFFMMGFANFRLGIALTLAGLAAWELALRTGAARWWLAYFALAGAGYLMHLSALVFLVSAVGALSALRWLDGRERFVRLLAAGLPILLLLGWHTLMLEPVNPYPSLQPTAWSKLWRLASPFVRFRDAPDLLLFAGFALTVTAAIAASLRGRATDRERELGVLVVAFVIIYFALPESKGAIWAIDNRAMSIAWLAAALLAAHVAPRLGHGRVVAGAALAIAAANVGLLAVKLVPQDGLMREYRALAATVPRGAVVLPVLTRPKLGYMNPTAHAASFATIDRDAIVPYTFSGDVGMPMEYFRFRRRPEAPWQFWYQAGYPPDGGASTLAHYPYLLVDVPADWSRIPVHGTVIRRNRAVALVSTGTAPGGPRLAEGGRGRGG
jgi:hypothetical protein